MWGYYIGFQSKAEEESTTPLSSAPCTPAPGRRIIIIRCDNQLSPVNLFISFDRVVPPVPPDHFKSHRRTGSADSTDSNSTPAKRRWGLLRSVFGGSSNTRSADGQTSSSSSDDSEDSTADPTVTPESKCLDEHVSAPNQSVEDLIRPKTPHQPFFFKFSLEWTDRPQWPSKNKRLFTPCLPVASQLHVQQRRSSNKTSECETASEDQASDWEHGGDEKPTEDHARTLEPAPENQSRTPTTKNSPLPELPSEASYDHLVASKYAGRALAEWAHIVSECDSFFARRRGEGVPNDRMVETPTLGVETFRK